MIKRFLRRWPKLYQTAQRAYYATLYWLERHVLGSRLHELFWRFRRFDDFGVRRGVHPHRQFLAEKLKARRFSSLLEVGCSAGANLEVIARAIPGMRLHGVDVNRNAIAEVQRHVSTGALPNTTASLARADALGEFADDSFDVVLADATLMYVGPDKIDRALHEMVRVARYAVVVNDWHLFEPRDAAERSRWYDAHWVHDYKTLLGAQAAVGLVRVERLPAGMWSGGGWVEYGAFVYAEVLPCDATKAGR